MSEKFQFNINNAKDAMKVEALRDSAYEEKVDSAELRLTEIANILADLRDNPAEYSPEYIESLAKEQEELEKQRSETNRLRNTKLNFENN